MSKGAVLGLLTKVYATWAGYPVKDHTKWAEAAKTAKVLVESQKHDLLNDFEQLWDNTCNGVWDPTESLIEISFYSPTASGGASDPCGRIGKWNGVKTTMLAGERGSCAGNVKVVHPFVLKWREKDLADGEVYHPETVKDKRLNLSVANYQYNPNKVLYAKGKSDTDKKALENDADSKLKNKEKQNYTPAKWDIEKYVKNKLINNDKSNVNWYFLRYADVLLLYAEALNELNETPTTDVYYYVQQVRNKAGLDEGGSLVNTWRNHSNRPDKPTTQRGMREIIQKERMIELAFEGHRWWDLKRWMEADNIWTGNENDRTAQRLGLWPYRVVADGDANNGKWVFVEKNMQTLDLWRKPLKCTDVQYYSEIDNGWINNNPKLVKNPYQ